jgi:hypothetical protein
MRVVQARAAGGTGDMRVRAQVQILRKYIPGNPIIVHEFMAGGGGRTAANHIFRTAPPDGLTIGAMTPGFVPSAVLGETGVLYDLEKTIYLGAPDGNAQWIFATRKGLGADNLAKLRGTSGLRIGAQAVGHPIYLTGRLFAYLLGLKEPRFVTGYTPREIDFALERNEIDARVSILDSLLTRNAHWLDKELVHIHATIDIPKGFKHADVRLAKLPEIESFARSNQERRLIQLFRGARDTGQPFVLPPGTPAEQVKILREAMRKAFADPEYIKAYEKLTSEPAMPLTWEEFETQLRELPREAEIIDLFKRLSGPAPLPARPSR